MKDVLLSSFVFGLSSKTASHSGPLNRFGIKDVVVVKDQHEMVRDAGDVIEQGCQNRFG